MLNASFDEAVALLDRAIQESPERARSVFFVNAHTLNTAMADPEYHALLNEADYVFGDGTGVRWAARFLKGVELRDNLNGTDFVPRLLTDLGGKGYRYYMLGTNQENLEAAVAHVQAEFPGWELAGYHHGFLEPSDHAAMIDEINASGSQMLLVAMGNPKQEQWIMEHLGELRVPLCLGIGALFDYWSGAIERAPEWIRKIGYEWLYVTVHQRHKVGRYLVGNPLFLMRLAKSKWLDAEKTSP